MVCGAVLSAFVYQSASLSHSLPSPLLVRFGGLRLVSAKAWQTFRGLQNSHFCMCHRKASIWKERSIKMLLLREEIQGKLKSKKSLRAVADTLRIHL